MRHCSLTGDAKIGKLQLAAKNGFYIFKWLEKNDSYESSMKIKFQYLQIKSVVTRTPLR